MKTPCYKCEMRSERCHNTCAAYAEFAAMKEKERLAKCEQHEMENYDSTAGFAKIERKRNQRYEKRGMKRW